MKLFKNTIQHKISYALGGIITLFFLLILGFDYLQSMKQGQTNLEIELNFVTNFTSESLKTPLWNLDDNSIQDVIAATLTHPDITYLSLENVLTDKVTKISNEVYTPNPQNILYKEADLHYDTTKIGKLTIGLSPYRNNQVIRRQIITTGLKYLILEILVILSIHFIVKTIVKPLNALTNRAKDVTIKNLNVDFDVIGTEEIQTLARAFNEMVLYLQRDIDIIHTQTKTISLFNQDLEHKIKERTQHLEMVILELENTQEMLAESKKLASMGQLVSGMAHELNTPIGNGITSISHIESGTQTILKNLMESGIGRKQLTAYLENTLEASNVISSSFNTLSKLIHQFKQLSDTVFYGNMESFDLKSIVLTVFDFEKNHYPDLVVQLRLDIHETLSFASYPNAFMSIFKELFNNAFQHGFQGKANGLIEVAVSIQSNTLKIIFKDDGHGIMTEHLPFIFNPFYTTSRAYDGNGLGLSILYNTIATFNGKVTCENRTPSGTIFSIALPLSDQLKLDL